MCRETLETELADVAEEANGILVDHGSRRLGSGAVSTDAGVHERLVQDLRRHLARPVVLNSVVNF